MRLRIHYLQLLMAAVVALAVTACDDSSNLSILDPETPFDGTNENKNDASSNPDLSRLEFPKVKGAGTNGSVGSIVVIHRTDNNTRINYSLEWDCDKKSQRWSCYQMYAGNSGGYVGRYDTTYGYPHDPEIPAGYKFNDDLYWRSGYDHGHICPSADRQYSKEANTQTFYLSNMQPQRNIFNAGVWADMESQLRNKWNTNNFRERLYVAKGGTIDKEDQIRGYINSQLIIPKYFFMAILCEDRKGNYKAIGFWIEHKDTDQSRQLNQYVVSIDRLEQLTGIDFFCNLPDNIEQEVESATRAKMISDWNL